MVASARLGHSTSSQLPAESAAILVPVGSTEQHGPHLPLDTDTRVATAVAQSTAERLGDQASGHPPRHHWLVAPAIAYGASGEHQSFAGTISIGIEALTLLLVEYGRSAACWARRLVFVNGHGGNTAALGAAVDRLRLENRDVAWCPCAVAGSDAHAGHTETSILLHLAPGDVQAGRCRVGNTAPLATLLPAMRSGGIAAASEIGVLGDPTAATAADGERILAAMSGGCARRINDWTPGADGMLR